MPHLKSPKKRLRQSKVRRVRNRAMLSDLKTQVKKLFKEIKDKNVAGAKEQLKAVFRKLDKAGARRYLHPNAAHRHKSRLAKRVAALETGTPS